MGVFWVGLGCGQFIPEVLQKNWHLCIQVEQEFYIPKLSQNWIIGPRLVRGTELNKPIKEFGIKGEGVQEVSVFMYVMHTKKAQVPNEAIRVRQQQHVQQQQQGLQPTQLQAQVRHMYMYNAGIHIMHCLRLIYCGITQ